jgi:hypothetical protein
LSGLQKLWMAIYWWFWSIFQPESMRENYEEFKSVHNTAFLVQAYLWANIRYRKDTKPWHDWQPGIVTWRIGKGDCEDWAVLACDCLRDDHNCWYLCIYTEESGHATLLVDRERVGGYISVGTFGLQEHDGEVPGIVKDWSGYKDWTMAVLMDEDQNVLNVWYR